MKVNPMHGYDYIDTNLKNPDNDIVNFSRVSGVEQLFI
jgi:hypothetical protein